MKRIDGRSCRRCRFERLAVDELNRIRPTAIAGLGFDPIMASRSRANAMTRWAMMVLLHRAGASLPAIGAAMQRHHTSVLHGLRCSDKIGSVAEMVRALDQRNPATVRAIWAAWDLSTTHGQLRAAALRAAERRRAFQRSEVVIWETDCLDQTS